MTYIKYDCNGLWGQHGWVEQRETHRSRKEFDGFRYRSTHPTKLKASSLDKVKRNRGISFDYL